MELNRIHAQPWSERSTLYILLYLCFESVSVTVAQHSTNPPMLYCCCTVSNMLSTVKLVRAALNIVRKLYP